MSQDAETPLIGDNPDKANEQEASWREEKVGKHDSCCHFPDFIFLLGWLGSVGVVIILACVYGIPSIENIDDILDDEQQESLLGSYADDLDDVWKCLLVPFYTFITCLLFSLAWLVVLLACGRFIMYLFFIVLIGGFGIATVMLWDTATKLAFFTGVACAATLVWGCGLRARMDFASKTLQIACHVVLEYTTLVVMSIVAMFATGAYLIFWVLAVIGLILRFKYEVDDDEHVGTDIFFSLTFLLLFFLWTAEVLKNIVMVTVMGTTADWWYGHETTGVTFKNFFRACTWNLGAICFGSLLVAIVETLEYVLKFIETECKEAENIVLKWILKAAQCLLACLKCCIEYMTSYAYVFVAINGYGFIGAGMEVLKLVADDLPVMVINDSLVSMVCFVGQLLVTALGCVTSLYLVKNKHWADSLPDAETNLTFVGGCVGWTIGAIVFGLILAANKTVLVLWKEKPRQLHHRHEAFYEDLHAIWTKELGKTERETDLES